MTLMENPTQKPSPTEDRSSALAVAADPAPSQRSVEAAWRIWKGEVKTGHAPIQSVTEMAQIIEDLFFPKEHLCWAHQDFTHTCMVCGKSVPNTQGLTPRAKPEGCQ